MYDNERLDLIQETIIAFRRSEHRLKKRDRRYGLLPYIEGYTETEVSKFKLNPSPEQIVMRKLEVQTLMDTMCKLPLLQRQRIYAYFFLERSMTQIALAEGVSITAVSRSIQLGLRNLRRLMEEMEESEK